MSALVGTFRSYKMDNMSSYLKAAGVGKILRSMFEMINLTWDVEIKELDTGEWSIKFQSVVKTFCHKFQWDVPFEDKVDGDRECRVVYTLESPTKIVRLSKPKDGRLEERSEMMVDDDELEVFNTVFTPEGKVTCTSYYKRIAKK